MMFVIIAIIIIFVLEYTNRLDTNKFLQETEPLFKGMMEDDYKFYANVKYGEDLDINKMFNQRVRNALIVMFIALFVMIMSKPGFISIIIALIIGFIVFKLPYMQLQSYYKAHLSQINQLLPYYLKGLEILIQHYTVPVALRKSIDTAPTIFKGGLKRLCDKIEQGDSSIDPYMDFAHEFPVRDSMRMMRLLYRLGLGAQENKQEQLVMFSRNISSLQNKAREQKYQARLDHMEGQTMKMLFVTGGGILALLMISMMSMIG